MRMMRFTYTISHVPGRNLTIADTLSRAPLEDSDSTLQEEADAFVNFTIQSLPATEIRLQQIRQLQQQDEVCRSLTQYCHSGWPERKKMTDSIKPFYHIASELSVEDGILLRGCRIVIPEILRHDILERLHTGHQGIVKCRARARQSVWWPGLSSELEKLVKNCNLCCKEQYQRAEPLRSSELPDLPFQKVGTDLFEWSNRTYLLLIDYYSRYIEIALLNHPTAREVITNLKSIFARHRIPEQVISDNGPQYSSQAFTTFAKEYQFQHVTSSPLYPQGNGEAERAIKTIKWLLKKESDP